MLDVLANKRLHPQFGIKISGVKVWTQAFTVKFTVISRCTNTSNMPSGSVTVKSDYRFKCFKR